MNKIFSFIAIAIFFALPLTTNAVLAGNILDPLCLFSWRDECKDSTTYNINSNINSPGGIIIGNTSVIDTNPYSYGSTHIYSGGYYEDDNGYYEGGSEYHYDDDYHGNNNYSLNVSCYPDDRYVEEGDDVRWTASVSGGNGSYDYDWSGSEGLDGNSRTVTIEYDHEGTKSASVRVSSGSKSVTESCGNVYVENDNDHDYDDDDDYDNDNFSISCEADDNTAYVGERVRWEVDVRGASIRDIEWSGTEGLDGDDEDVSITYDYSGYKSAHVEVRTNEGTKSRSCGSVYVSDRGYSYNQVPTYTVNSNTGVLNVICSAYPLNTTVNKTVTWIATATGGKGGYTYSWTGTDGVKGGQTSLVTAYTTPGVKSTVLTVRSNSGEVVTKACEQTVTISSYSSSASKPKVVAPVVEKEETKNSATSIFSLGNVPWGGVALITIFVLFSTVMYLVFTKKD